jgi:hypothetical protein
MSKKHYLEGIRDEVNKTHPGLGNLVVLETLVVKCHKLLLVISPAGCGKSRASQYVGKQATSSVVTDRLSVAGLANMVEELNNFDGAVVIDDIAKTQTKYARISTITALAELVYSHFISSNMSKLQFHIQNFNGSAIINIQPVILKEIVKSDEWEASIQDKAIRYYHLKRPLTPVDDLPKPKLSWGIPLSEVETPDMTTKQGQTVIEVAKGQWGRARTLEHCSGLVRASASLDNRKKVNASDYKLVSEILLPLRYEQLVLEKKDFESSRELSDHRLALLTQMTTYGEFTIDNLSDDYHIAHSQAYKLMQKYAKDWQIVSKSPTTYAPSIELTKELINLGLIHTNGSKPNKGGKS